MPYTSDDISRANDIYAAAYQAALGSADVRDQAGFAAIEAAFPDMGIHAQLDLLQYAQESLDAALVVERRAA